MSKTPISDYITMQSRAANNPSSASPACCAAAWTDAIPTEPGMYLNRHPGSVCLVRVPRSELIGIVAIGTDFYNRVPLEQWTGEWFGPIPW